MFLTSSSIGCGHRQLKKEQFFCQIAEYENALRDVDGTTRSTLERQLAENRATLRALEKVLQPYGHARS
jgi:hypothetical protein